MDRQRNHPIEPVTCTRNRSGKLTFSIDPNDVKTAYSYDDALDRLTQIRRVADTPAENQTNIAYNGATDVNVYRDQSGLVPSFETNR